MGAISRINKSPLSQRNKSVLRNALKDASTTKYVTADQAIPVSSTAHLVVSDCTVPVKAGKVYRFDANVYCTSANAAAGAQISFTGSATASFITGMYLTQGLPPVISGGITVTPNAAPQMTVITAIADESDATVGLHTAVLVKATGTYSPSADGFFKLSAGGCGSSANAGAVKKGSYLTLTEILV